MGNTENSPYRFNSLSDLHRVLGLPKPLHPMISLVNNSHNTVALEKLPPRHLLNFYKISYKLNFCGQFRYGQHWYDFDEGGLFFVSPNQLVADPDHAGDHSGYTLLIHPDFLLSYPLATKIRQYGFFSYTAHEALHLSDQEKNTIIALFKTIEEELAGRIDDFSQDVLISQIELLLNYANRFYRRQFITRKKMNHDFLQNVEDVLDDYFNNGLCLQQGVPSVQYISERLHFSPGYISDLLRSLTGQNAQQYIHQKLIEKAKEKLSATDLSVSEIAYELGFEHPQSFSKLFRSKTHVTPLAFRKSFN